jgi:taurine dioxygenase
MEFKSITPHLGAEVTGIDLSKAMDAETFEALRTAWLEWGVLVFRDQCLNRDQHIALGHMFGVLHVHPMYKDKKEHREILKVATNANSAYTAGDGWHTDVTCDEFPPMGSMLYITETPSCGGGDTLFADMYLAYDLLSDTMKELLQGLTAIHDGALPYTGSYKSAAPEGGYPRNEHPVIVTHPETGKKVLYVNSGFTSHIKGLRANESRALLEMLFRHISSTPKLVARVNWEPNTLTFWDNRCTQHHAVWDYYPESRYGERVSIVGDTRPAV